MKHDQKTPEFYLDWFFRILEEECAKRNYLFSEEGKTAFRQIWWRQCEGLATDPTGLEDFRLGKATMHHKVARLGQLTATAADFSRSLSIGAGEVIRGSKAYIALDVHRTPRCPTIEDVHAADQTT